MRHFALDYELVDPGFRRRRAPARPDDEQVGAPAAEAVLPLDAPPAVHHALQERLQNELRARLRVVETAQPVLRVLAEERLESAEQLVDVQTAVGVDVPGNVLQQLRLDGVGELPRHDFRVDGVGDARRIVACDQAQVADVLQVTGG